MNWEREMQGFAEDIQKSVAGKDQEILSQLARGENECFTSARDDSEKFVKCMSDQMKKFEKEERKFEFRMAFFQAKTAECFKNSNGNPQEIQKCRDTAKSNLEKYFSDFVNSLR